MNIRSTLAVATALALTVAMPAYGGSMKSSDSTTSKSSVDKTTPKKGTTTGSGPGASEYAPGRDPGTASTNNPGRSDTLPPGQQMNQDRSSSTPTRR
jgi:hypothetical protein